MTLSTQSEFVRVLNQGMEALGQQTSFLTLE